MHLKVRYARATAKPASAFETLLAEHGLRPISIDQSLDGGIFEYGAIADGYDEERAERLAATLSADADVEGFEIRPQPA